MYWPPFIFSATSRQNPHNSAEDFYNEEKKPRTKTSLIAGGILGLLLIFGGWNTLTTSADARISYGEIEWKSILIYSLPCFFAMILGVIIIWKIFRSLKRK